MREIINILTVRYRRLTALFGSDEIESLISIVVDQLRAGKAVAALRVGRGFLVYREADGWQRLEKGLGNATSKCKEIWHDILK